MDIIRAWKDAEYRRSLTAEELAALPENPAGMIELTDEELGGVNAAADDVIIANTRIWQDGCTVVTCLTCGANSCPEPICTANCSWFCPTPTPTPKPPPVTG